MSVPLLFCCIRVVCKLFLFAQQIYVWIPRLVKFPCLARFPCSFPTKFSLFAFLCLLSLFGGCCHPSVSEPKIKTLFLSFSFASYLSLVVNTGHTMSLIFDEYGRPFIVIRDQEDKKRLSGLDAHKVEPQSLLHTCPLSWCLLFVPVFCDVDNDDGRVRHP